MFENDETTSAYVENFKTLHKDIGLVKRSNGTWDLWFGQDEISKNYTDKLYLDIIPGDLVSATQFHSLQVGIIVACLTSWNYLNRVENPVYESFGNKAYSLLKMNKNENTRYKIQQFFIECLERMRRVYNVESLEVYDVVDNPHMYHVTFSVLSISNSLVDGEFYLTDDNNKSFSKIDITYNHPYTSVANPLIIEATLKNEYGSFINGEILYVYIKKSEDDKFKYYGITEATNEKGKVKVTIAPKGLSTSTEVMLIFKGNTLYNPSYSKIINIESVAYYIKSRYEGDKHILYIEDSLGDSTDRFRLSELLTDYLIDVDDFKNKPNIIIDPTNFKTGKKLIYHDYEKRKIFLLRSDKKIEGTNKYYYNGYVWNEDQHNELLLIYKQNIQLNTEKPTEIHFLINDSDNGLFEIDFEDGHLYYKTSLKDNEI